MSKKLSLWILCGALATSGLASPTFAASGNTAASQQTGVLVDFCPESKVRPKINPYPLTITDLDTTPSTVGTKDVPDLTGSFAAGDGSIVLTLDGRSDDTTSWVADTWSGGTSCPVKGSEAGLGISDTVGGNKVDDGEAIIWSFDLSSLKLDPGESLVMTAADFGGFEEGEQC